MGWTGTYKEKGTSYDEFFDAEYGNESRHVWAGKGFTKNGAYYRAMKNTETGEIFAIIILVQNAKPGPDGINFFYKTMDETEGPYNYDCPARILDLLTPTTSEWAQEWRKKCREHIDRNSRLEIGSRIRFKNPVTFTSGRTASVFEIIRDAWAKRKKMALKAIPDKGEPFLCRIHKWQNYEFEIIG